MMPDSVSPYPFSASVGVGAYRYALTRRWELGPCLCWIMLNPSTADATQDDPTIRRCIGFAQRWGFAGIHVVNLFALRTTRPVHLTEVDDPVGSANRRHLRTAVAAHNTMVAAWGGSGDFARRYMETRNLYAICDEAQRQLWCLGTTKNGDPRHPLYVKGDKSLELFR